LYPIKTPSSTNYQTITPAKGLEPILELIKAANLKQEAGIEKIEDRQIWQIYNGVCHPNHVPK